MYSTEGKKLEPVRDTDHGALLEASPGFPVPISEERNFDQGQHFKELSVDLFAAVSKEFEVDHELPLDVDPVCPLPVMSKRTKMWMTYIEGPDSLWLQRVCDADTVAELLDKMYMFYETEEKGVSLEVSENKLCAAKSGSDNQWYRGKILSVDVSDGTCTVLFIDYGNSETIPVDHVKELDASLFTPHAQAICTALAVDFVHKERITSELSEMIADKELTVVFGLKRENVWLVDLFLDLESISKKLVDMGLVKGFEAHLFRSELKEETSYDVFVSHIDSPCSFWVQKAEDSQEILKLQEELQVAAGMLESMTSPPPVGTMCIGIFAEAWYRAVVLESNLSLVTLCFIDYGNVEIIDVTCEGLKPLPEKLQNIPGYAERCSLLGSNEGYTFHIEAAEKMEHLVASTDRSMTVHVLSDGEIKHVNLFSPDRNSVLLTLVNEGLVTKTGFMEQMSAVNTHITGVPVVDAQITEEITCGDISPVVDTQVTGNISVIDAEAIEELPAVFVTYIKSPSEFWIQYESDTSQIQEVQNRLFEAESFSVLDAPVEGVLCAAKYTDGTWYRVKILQVTDLVEVFFLDYGNHTLSTELRCLPEDLISVPPLAKCCSLCLPDGVTEWSVAANEKFIERAGGGFKFQVKILEEADCALVSLLEDGQTVEEGLLNLCMTVDKAPTICVKPSKLYAWVSHVISPREFWIQLENSLLHLNEISGQVAESENFPTLNDIEEGVLCVAQFPEDGNWYRARILSHSNGCVEVIYVDYGNTAISTELRELSDELKNVPSLAKKCSLSISGDMLEWPETVSDAFLNMVSEMAKLFEIEIIRDGDPAVISMWYDGKNIEEELLKIVESKKDIASAESEILTETCTDETNEGSVFNEEEAIKEGIENLSENHNAEQVREEQETFDENSIKDFQGINDLDMSEKQNKGIREKAQDEIIEQKEERQEEDVAKHVTSFSEQGEANSRTHDGELIVVGNVQNTENSIKDQIEDRACSDNFILQEPEEFKENMSGGNIKIKSTKESTKDVSDSLNTYTLIKTDDKNGKSEVCKEDVQNRFPDNVCTAIKTDDESGKDSESNENVQERFLDNTCTVTKTDDEIGKGDVCMEDAQKIFPGNVCTVIKTDDESGIDNVSKENVQERSVDNTGTVIKTDDEDRKDKMSEDNVQERSLDNTCTVIKTVDENHRDEVSKVNVQGGSSELHFQKTQHTEKLVREINIEMKTPSEAVSKMPACLYDERIVPTSISKGHSRELGAMLNRHPPPNLVHAEKIVPGCISHCRLPDSDKDEIKSAPTTPLVSRSERILHRVLSYEGFGQRTPTCAKLNYNDMIDSENISRGKSQEETHPFSPKLPHAEKIVPGSISRGISDEVLECKTLQAGITEAPEQRAAEDDSMSVEM